MPVRRLDTYALLFVTTGRGHVTGPPDGVTVPLVAPAVVWLFPGVAHRYDPTGDGWDEHWVLFEGIAVRAYEGLGAWQRLRPVRAAAAGLADAVAPFFAALRRVTATPGPRAELLAATLTHALVGVAAEQTQGGADRGGVAVRTAAEEVVATALRPLTVAQRARAGGRTPEQLRRAVAEETGLAVHELVVRTRVARAQELLAGTDLPVSGVAAQVGYDDAAYFSRLFRARVGVSPSAFREQALR